MNTLPDILGMNMTCNVQLDEFPIDELQEVWCDGGLYNYLYP